MARDLWDRDGWVRMERPVWVPFVADSVELRLTVLPEDTDQAIVDGLGQPALDELCRQLTEGLRTAGPTEALCEAIRAAGDRLAGVLPRTEDDVNELPDGLVTID